MKKTYFIALLLLVLLPLSACGHEHEHSWLEADCTRPRVCTGCGLTEGEALEHSWKEANFQDPQICSSCGARQGEPVKGSFPKSGLKCNMQLGKEHDYVTNCRDDRERQTVGKAKVSSYTVINGDETHEEREGRQWQTVTISVLFDDDNAKLFKPRYSFAIEDFYDGRLLEDSMKTSGTVGSYSIRFHEGIEEISYSADVQWSETEKGESLMELTVEFDAPKGYDGIVVGLINAGKIGKGPLSQSADATSLFFRLEPKLAA